MGRLDEKSSNEILLEIKQLQMEHLNLKDRLLKDYDTIEMLKDRMKKDYGRLLEVENIFSENNSVVVKRLKGEI
jgi:hypothetical protein